MVEDKAKTKIPAPKCPICGENWEKHPKPGENECPNGKSCGKRQKCGWKNVGNPTRLESMIAKKSGRRKSNALYYKDSCLAAHHLICSEAMEDDDDWAKICQLSGYNINCYKNGVNLPTALEQACHAKIPLHKGGHGAGYGGNDNKAYPGEVIKEIRSVLEDFDKEKICKDKEQLKNLVEKLNASSEKIFTFITEFIWTITWDGFDYELGNPIGCANVHYIPDKPKKLRELQEKRRKSQNPITTEVVNSKEKYIQKIEANRALQEDIVEKLKQDKDALSYKCRCIGRIHGNGVRPEIMADKYVLEISK